MAHQTGSVLTAFNWQPQPEAGWLVHEILGFCRERCAAVRDLEELLRRATGTRLFDWIDHLAVPAEEGMEARLAASGFTAQDAAGQVWSHPGAALPTVQLHDAGVRRVTIRVESVADFLAMHRVDLAAPIEGSPLARLRKAKIAAQAGVELWAVERHGGQGWEPQDPAADEIQAVLRHQERFRRRKRNPACAEEGFAHASDLVRSAIEDLDTDRTCDLFFAAEREYWASRNRAAGVQKARQDALGLGWANHDHHTYRSSREHFVRLIAVLEDLGLICRERFYAGEDAGWGAQVLEQAAAGIVVFADVDLARDEIAEDFAHVPLTPRDRFGTVGLWCKLHGEAFLQAGMHHLECRFDFAAAREQLERLGVPVMKPFTDLLYLKQAFTKGEIWPVRPERITALLDAGAIAREAAEQFRRSGAIGSHLEILQRDEGYKGFNKAGINEIISYTDPRRHGAL
ncbi:MAG: hypothetical protein HUU20_07175 [Pirellulales bacterium]|nr:hypothetical protein [Pirellulales bacterium]